MLRKLSLLVAFTSASFALCAQLPSVANAQSTITLEDFALEAPEPKAVTNEIDGCLLDSTKCAGSKFNSTTSFSIDDVVNLGIVDHSEVKPSKVSTGGKSKPATAVALPSIDLEILFEYDSDAIRSDEFAKLFEVSDALKKIDSNNYKFALFGHTDAKGSYDYNLELSDRRAKSTSEVLSQLSGIALDRFVYRGFGASKIKNTNNPFGEENRRVQLVLIPVNN